MSAAGEEDRALVQNAADEEQVETGKRKKQIQERRQANALAQTLGERPGRDVLWRILSHCGIHESVYNRDAIAMANLAGRQDVGHWLLQEILKADPEAYFTMMREAR